MLCKGSSTDGTGKRFQPYSAPNVSWLSATIGQAVRTEKVALFHGLPQCSVASQVSHSLDAPLTVMHILTPKED